MYNSAYTSSSRLKHSYNRQSIVSNVSQQKQIQELQKKVDMILNHNDILIKQNNNLRQLLQNRNVSTTTSNYQLNSLRKQLDLKDAQTQQLKNALKDEIDDLTKQLIMVKDSKQQMRLRIEKLQIQAMNTQKRTKFQLQEVTQSIRNQMYENALQKQSEYHQELSEKETIHKKQISDLIQENQRKIDKIEQEKKDKLARMDKKYKEEAQELRKMLENQFEKRVREIEKSSNQRCRKTRENSENYIKSILQNQKQNNQQTQDSLKKEIQALKRSLSGRQQLIEQLLGNQRRNTDADYNRYYREAQQLRQRIRQMTENFFRQSQLLKVKMAAKHQSDVREVGKAYESRIDVIAQKLNYYEIQNERLRRNYEDEIRAKMVLRNKFQMQGSKLKNIIRKMKVQLESYGKQLRLNIDGMKSQANSFSMSIIGSFEQQKVKKAFYEEQTHKLKQIIKMKDAEMDTTANQCEQKVRYYSEKMQLLKQRIKEDELNYTEQEQRYLKQIQSQKQGYQRQIQQTIDHYKKQIELLQEANNIQKQKYQQISDQLVDSNNQVSVLKKQIKDNLHEIQSLKAHIQTIKMQMQMMDHTVNPDEIIKPLKQHYQRIIQDIQKDKQNLQATNSIQSDQMARLIAKYKALQISMQKTLSSLHKRRQLDQKVIQLGMDNNLVKNLSELFRKNEV